MAADAVEWGYEGPIGPERWASLSEAYAACGGEQQSPVDISGYEAWRRRAALLRVRR